MNKHYENCKTLRSSTDLANSIDFLSGLNVIADKMDSFNVSEWNIYLIPCMEHYQ